MKIEYINPFLMACADVVNQMCQINIERGKPFIKKGTFPIESVAVSVGIAGEVKGEVLYCMNKETAFHVASLLMCGMEVIEFHDLCKSAISELGNIITGHASIELSKMGHNIDITPPKVLVGQEIQVFMPNAVTICVPMKLTDRYVIDINVSLK
ncbi:MAG: chemotaxis protein CheX [Bacillota bacterium]|nr:chemotaxis protein CheX [Bacillota bacterium]